MNPASLSNFYKSAVRVDSTLAFVVSVHGFAIKTMPWFCLDFINHLGKFPCLLALFVLIDGFEGVSVTCLSFSFETDLLRRWQIPLLCFTVRFRIHGGDSSASSFFRCREIWD